MRNEQREGKLDALDDSAADRPGVLELRDLEAPEPMERILEGAARLEPGEALLARTPRFPRMLASILVKRDLDWEMIELADGSGLVWVRKPV